MTPRCIRCATPLDEYDFPLDVCSQCADAAAWAAESSADFDTPAGGSPAPCEDATMTDDRETGGRDARTPAIPAGYAEDAQGRLVPKTQIRPRDLQRDQIVRDLIGRVQGAAAFLADLKRDLLDEVAAHVSLVAEEYQVNIGGERGSVRLTSYDGRLMLERSTADRIVVGEEIHAAEALIREILDEIADPAARAIADRAFRRHPKTGELSASRLVDLVTVEIADPRWTRATQAIRESLRVAGTATYFRAYRRERADKPWEQVVIDFSGIAPAAPRVRPAAPVNPAQEVGDV